MSAVVDLLLGRGFRPESVLVVSFGVFGVVAGETWSRTPPPSGATYVPRALTTAQRRRVRHLVAGAATAVVTAYLLVVWVNSVSFDYSFWDDSAPSEAADTFAVASLWFLAAFAGVAALAGVAAGRRIAGSEDLSTLSAVRGLVRPWGAVAVLLLFAAPTLHLVIHHLLD